MLQLKITDAAEARELRGGDVTDGLLGRKLKRKKLALERRSETPRHDQVAWAESGGAGGIPNHELHQRQQLAPLPGVSAHNGVEQDAERPILLDVHPFNRRLLNWSPARAEASGDAEKRHKSEM